MKRSQNVRHVHAEKIVNLASIEPRFSAILKMDFLAYIRDSTCRARRQISYRY